MKIYTKKGDEGETSLIGGNRVAKDHLRIEAYGTIDELNSWIGLLRNEGVNEGVGDWLLGIQNTLFIAGSLLAAVPGAKMNLPELSKAPIEALEKAIDEMDKELDPLKNFVLPGGSAAISHCHIARCVCRRAERRLVSLISSGAEVKENILPYMNRLSDFLFTLSRYTAMKTGITETPWIP
jgi:cob(I)alamin adenosyltransferase